MKDEEIANCNGVRLALLERRKAEAAKNIPVKKKRPPKIILSENLMARLVRTFEKRTGAQKAQISAKEYEIDSSRQSNDDKSVAIVDTMLSGRSPSQLDTSQRSRCRYSEFHKKVAETRQERASDSHGRYQNIG